MLKHIQQPRLKDNPRGLLAWDDYMQSWNLPWIAKFPQFTEIFADESLINELMQHSEFSELERVQPRFSKLAHQYRVNKQQRVPHQDILSDIRMRGVHAWLEKPTNVDATILAQWTDIRHANTNLSILPEWHQCITRTSTPQEYAERMLPIVTEFALSKNSVYIRPHFAQEWYLQLPKEHRDAVEHAVHTYLMQPQCQDECQTFVYNTLKYTWMIPFSEDHIRDLLRNIRIEDMPYIQEDYSGFNDVRIPKTWWIHTPLYQDPFYSHEWIRRIPTTRTELYGSDDKTLDYMLKTYQARIEQGDSRGIYTSLISMAYYNAANWNTHQRKIFTELTRTVEADRAIDYITWDRWPDEHTAVLRQLLLTPDRCIRYVDALMNVHGMESTPMVLLLGSDPIVKSLLHKPNMVNVKDMVITGLLYYAGGQQSIDDAYKQYATLCDLQAIHPDMAPSTYLYSIATPLEIPDVEWMPSNI